MSKHKHGKAAQASADTTTEQNQDAAAASEQSDSSDPAGDGSPAADGTAGASAEADQSGQADPPAGVESDEAFEERVAEHQRQREQLRAETPPQVVKIRPEARQQLLGMVVLDGWNGKVLRTSRLEHWRTEQVELRAGERAFVVVLVGNDLEEFESVERNLKAETEKAAAAGGEA